MTRKFRVTIGGITYMVEVEEVGGGAPAQAPVYPAAPLPVSGGGPAPVYTPAPAPAAPAPAPAPAAPAAVPTRKASAAGEVVKAPLPGIVAALRCEVGQPVTQGQVVVVLEAMKMENDITAPVAGTVKEILVRKGSAVAVGDTMVVIG